VQRRRTVVDLLLRLQRDQHVLISDHWVGGRGLVADAVREQPGPWSEKGFARRLRECALEPGVVARAGAAYQLARESPAHDGQGVYVECRRLGRFSSLHCAAFVSSHPVVPKGRNAASEGILASTLK
jgi:hypothetical protein